MIKPHKQYTPAPEGVHNAICVDVTPFKQVETQYGPKMKARIVFELEEKMKDGRPFTIGCSITPSMHEKSRMAKIVKSWRGSGFTPAELRDGFDEQKLVGACAQVVVSHTEKDGETYANIETVLKPVKKIQASGKYIRVKDREQQPPAAKPPTEDELNAELETASEADKSKTVCADDIVF